MNTRKQGILRVILEAGYHRMKLRENADCGSSMGLWGQHHLPPPLAHQRDDWPEGRLCATSHQQQFQARCTHTAQGNVWKHGSILECLTSSIWDPGCWLLLANTFLLLIVPLINERGRGAQSVRKEWPHDLRKMIRNNTSVASGNLLPQLNLTARLSNWPEVYASIKKESCPRKASWEKKKPKRGCFFHDWRLLRLQLSCSILSLRQVPYFT